MINIIVIMILIDTTHQILSRIKTLKKFICWSSIFLCRRTTAGTNYFFLAYLVSKFQRKKSIITNYNGDFPTNLIDYNRQD